MDDIKAEVIGANIRRMLEMSGKQQKDMAAFCGVSSSTASAWTKGQKTPRPDKMPKICEFFGCTLHELMLPASTYYQYSDAEQMAQFLYENPEYHTLFDAVRRVRKEDLEFVKDFIDRLKR